MRRVRSLLLLTTAILATASARAQPEPPDFATLAIAPGSAPLVEVGGGLLAFDREATFDGMVAGEPLARLW